MKPAKKTHPFARIFSAVAAFAIVAGFSGLAHAQSGSYPNRPVRIVVPYAPGGGADTLARIVAAQMQIKTGQTVIVENRAGAGGNLGSESVWRAAPDGYTLMLTPHPPLVVNQALYEKLAFDPNTFVPISVLTTAYSQLLIHPNVPATNLRQFIAYAKANPGKLNYASQGIGNNGHLSAELFNTMAGVQIVHVPYKGTGPALLGLLGGQVEMMVVEGSTVETHVKAGRLRLLAIGSESRLPSLPDVPTVAEELPGYLAQTWLGVVAPPGTPMPLANEISALFTDIMKQPNVVARIAELKIAIVASKPDEMMNFLKQERARWGGVIRATNAKAN